MHGKSDLLANKPIWNVIMVMTIALFQMNTHDYKAEFGKVQYYF